MKFHCQRKIKSCRKMNILKRKLEDSAKVRVFKRRKDLANRRRFKPGSKNWHQKNKELMKMNMKNPNYSKSFQNWYIATRIGQISRKIGNYWHLRRNKKVYKEILYRAYRINIQNQLNMTNQKQNHQAAVAHQNGAWEQRRTYFKNTCRSQMPWNRRWPLWAEM